MSQDIANDFRKAVLASAEMPSWARENVANAKGIEAKILEQSYLNFLDDMIVRAPRGPEWTEILKRRRTALANYCGRLLVSGFIYRTGEHLFIKIDPSSQRVLYWESWPEMPEASELA